MCMRLWVDGQFNGFISYTRILSGQKCIEGSVYGPLKLLSAMIPVCHF